MTILCQIFYRQVVKMFRNFIFQRNFTTLPGRYIITIFSNSVTCKEMLILKPLRQNGSTDPRCRQQRTSQKFSRQVNRLGHKENKQPMLHLLPYKEKTLDLSFIKNINTNIFAKQKQ